MQFNASQQYFSYIVPVSFIGKRNWSIQRKQNNKSKVGLFHRKTN